MATPSTPTQSKSLKKHSDPIRLIVKTWPWIYCKNVEFDSHTYPYDPATRTAPHDIIDLKPELIPGSLTNKHRIKLNFVVKEPVAFHVSFDQGEGFSERDKKFVTLTSKNNSVVFSLSFKIKKIRLDFAHTDQPIDCQLKKISLVGSMQSAANLVINKLGSNPKLWWPKIRSAALLLRHHGPNALIAKLKGKQNSANYQDWINRFDTLDEKDIIRIVEHTKNLKLQPKFSIILPTYNTPILFLQKAIDSVLSQTYKNWELCIADDASTDPNVIQCLKEFAQKDQRIKLKLCTTNAHICAASNEALSLASGDYAAFLDHDDQLRPHALYMNLVEINKFPDAGLIYSDEDKISESGIRFDPYFKSDWNPELFVQQNFLCHLTVIKKEFIEQAGGFRVGYEGSQDWDLFLRVTEKLAPAQIRHIPHVLYHWRAIEGSTALSAGFKPYALESAKKAVSEHFSRKGINAETSIIKGIDQIKVEYGLPAKLPKVSLIIPTKDRSDLVNTCIESIIKKTTYSNFDITIVDNNSSLPETFRYFQSIQAKYPNVKVIQDTQKFNFSGINNQAVKLTDGEILGFINNDIEVISENWLTEMVSLACLENSGAIGARLWYPDNKLQHGGVITGIGGIAGHSHKMLSKGEQGYFRRAILRQNLSAVTAACLIVKRDVFEKSGGFDQENLSVAFNDVDLCLKIRELGFNNIWTPFAELYHYESVSRGYELTPEKFTRFQQETAVMRGRWGDKLLEDPFYNPNLSVEYEDFSLAIPPRVDKPWT